MRLASFRAHGVRWGCLPKLKSRHRQLKEGTENGQQKQNRHHKTRDIIDRISDFIHEGLSSTKSVETQCIHGWRGCSGRRSGEVRRWRCSFLAFLLCPPRLFWSDARPPQCENPRSPPNSSLQSWSRAPRVSMSSFATWLEGSREPWLSLQCPFERNQQTSLQAKSRQYTFKKQHQPYSYYFPAFHSWAFCSLLS